jgi:hypothetical protein
MFFPRTGPPDSSPPMPARAGRISRVSPGLCRGLPRGVGFSIFITDFYDNNQPHHKKGAHGQWHNINFRLR